MIRKYLDDVPQSYQDLLYDGQKIQAIKRYRAEENVDLRTAKERIELIEAQLHARFPDAYTPRRGGCSAQVALLALTIALFAIFA